MTKINTIMCAVTEKLVWNTAYLIKVLYRNPRCVHLFCLHGIVSHSNNLSGKWPSFSCNPSLSYRRQNIQLGEKLWHCGYIKVKLLHLKNANNSARSFSKTLTLETPLDKSADWHICHAFCNEFFFTWRSLSTMICLYNGHQCSLENALNHHWAFNTA